MYYFNEELLRRLPKLLGVSRMETARIIGVDHRTLSKMEVGNMPCERLAELCNVLRISLCHFITVTPKPVPMPVASDYMIPADAWKAVTWSVDALADLFGKDGSKTGVPKKVAARRIGSTNSQIFGQWTDNPSSMRIPSLLKILNEFNLDASLFFRDPNAPIPRPVIADGEGHVADILQNRLSNMEELERMNADKEDYNRSLRRRNERLTRENMALRRDREEGAAAPLRSGRVSERGIRYYSSVHRRGWSFHSELWNSLPSLFEMSPGEFSAAIGISNGLYRALDNAKMETLVTACNLLRISPSHFFVPKDEPAVVHDRTYYQIPKNMFIPVESRVENMKFLFGRYSVIGVGIDEFNRISGIGYLGFANLLKGSDTYSRVITLADICTQYGISPGVFFFDENRNKADYPQSGNERLLLNAIEMMKEIAELRSEVKKLKKKLKDTGKDVPED